MDSGPAMYEETEHGYEPYLLHTQYGQRTKEEEHKCAKALAEKVTYTIIRLRWERILTCGQRTIGGFGE